MKKHYYYDFMNFDGNEMNATIIDEKTLEQAEKGNNYLNPENFWPLGEFESIEDARQHYYNIVWDERYCKEHDC